MKIQKVEVWFQNSKLLLSLNIKQLSFLYYVEILKYDIEIIKWSYILF